MFQALKVYHFVLLALVLPTIGGVYGGELDRPSTCVMHCQIDVEVADLSRSCVVELVKL